VVVVTVVAVRRHSGAGSDGSVVSAEEACHLGNEPAKER
jgi:hypothetical protein